MGIYADNHERTDMIRDEKIFQHILSQLKGFDSVELQKLFSYENTPHGIVLTPLSYSALTALLGPISVEEQRHVDEQSHITDQVQYGIGANKTGQLQFGSNGLSDLLSFIQDTEQIGMGSNTKGISQVTEHRISDAEAYLQEKILIGMGANRSGLQTIDGQRNLIEEKRYIQEQLLSFLGVNKNGPFIKTESQKNISNEQSFIQNVEQIGQGSNVKGMQSITGNQDGSVEDQFIRYLHQMGQGSNIKGMQSITGTQEGSIEDQFIRSIESVGQGSNVKGVQSIMENKFGSLENGFIKYIEQIGQGVNRKGMESISTTSQLTDEQKLLANKQAGIAIRTWKKKHIKKNQNYVNKELFK
jgi:hypothetical protein